MKEVLFLEPARLTRPFFASLYLECETCIYDRFGDEWRPIRRCLPRDGEHFDAKEILNVLYRETRQSKAIQILVVSPTSSKELSDGIAAMAKKLQIQVVALSLPFHHKSSFRKEGVPFPPVVVCNSASGTRELGTAAAHELKTRRPGVIRPVVVLVPGDSRRIDSIHRLSNFKTGLGQAGLQPEFLRIAACNWSRSAARTKMRQVIDQVQNKQIPGIKTIDIVFAANDEMAIGVHEAIRESVILGLTVTNNTMVYGFDYIDEVRSLIAGNDFHFRGSVEQNLRKMAEALVGLMSECSQRILSFPRDNQLISPKCKLPAATGHRLQILSRWPNSIPALDRSSGEWVTEDRAALIDGVDRRTLGDYRKTAQGAAKVDKGRLVKDRFDRICRVDPVSVGQYWYLVKMLVNSP